MDVVSDNGSKNTDRLLRFIEKIFIGMLCLFLMITVLAQVILFSPKGRFLLSRVDRLEGIRLNVQDYVKYNP